MGGNGPPNGTIETRGKQGQVAIGYFIGTVVMAIGGVAELAFGVEVEQRQLEDIAEPLTAEERPEGEPPRDEAARQAGRFRAALREAVAEGSVRRQRGGGHAPAPTADPAGPDSARRPAGR